MISFICILLFVCGSLFGQTNAPLLFNTQQQSGIPTDSLIAYYPFNGNANDESGNGNDGTVNGATLTTDRNGNSNSAYNFNSANSEYIDFGVIQELKAAASFSISCWMRRASGSRLAIGDLTESANNGAYIFYDNTNDLFYSVRNGVSPYKKINNPGIFNEWHHITMIYNSSLTNENRVLLYINGEYVVHDDIVGTFPTATPNNTSPFYAGGQYYIGSVAYNDGDIDDIRIYSRILTASEITSLYNE